MSLKTQKKLIKMSFYEHFDLKKLEKLKKNLKYFSFDKQVSSRVEFELCIRT